MPNGPAPVLVQGLPGSWQTANAGYPPSAAGQMIIGRTKFTPPGHLLPHGQASRRSEPMRLPGSFQRKSND